MLAMLSYTELIPKKVIVIDDEPYIVVSTSGIVKKQRQKPHNTAKLRNLRSGNIVEQTFSQSDKIEEADIQSRDLKYLYTNRGESWFCESDNPAKRMSFSQDFIQQTLLYTRPNDIVKGVIFGDDVVAIELPIKVDLKVTEAPPNVRGNTAQGGNKVVTLETGATVTTPMFIEVGDIVRINTESGEYVERV